MSAAEPPARYAHLAGLAAAGPVIRFLRRAGSRAPPVWVPEPLAPSPPTVAPRAVLAGSAARPCVWPTAALAKRVPTVVAPRARRAPARRWGRDAQRSGIPARAAPSAAPGTVNRAGAPRPGLRARRSAISAFNRETAAADCAPWRVGRRRGPAPRWRRPVPDSAPSTGRLAATARRVAAASAYPRIREVTCARWLRAVASWATFVARTRTAAAAPWADRGPVT
jgi:hypothetical protein